MYPEIQRCKFQQWSPHISMLVTWFLKLNIVFRGDLKHILICFFMGWVKSLLERTLPWVICTVSVLIFFLICCVSFFSTWKANLILNILMWQWAQMCNQRPLKWANPSLLRMCSNLFLLCETWRLLSYSLISHWTPKSKWLAPTIWLLLPNKYNKPLFVFDSL